jgi:hypothetical protein
MSAFGGKADMKRTYFDVSFLTRFGSQAAKFAVMHKATALGDPRSRRH